MTTFDRFPYPLLVGNNTNQGQEFVIYMLFDFRSMVGLELPPLGQNLILNAVYLSMTNAADNPLIRLDVSTSQSQWTGMVYESFQNLIFLNS